MIPDADIVGVTVLLLTCSYMGHEFIRVGYYVNNEYMDESMREEPPAKVMLDKIQRNILAEKPRITRFPVPWDPIDPPTPSLLEAQIGESVAHHSHVVEHNGSSLGVGGGEAMPVV